MSHSAQTQLTPSQRPYDPSMPKSFQAGLKKTSGGDEPDNSSPIADDRTNRNSIGPR